MRIISIISAMIIFVLLACSGRKNEAERKDAIPQDKMVDIITDLYITDGLIVMPVVHQWYESKDSLSAYRDVIEKHGFTKDNFDRTMRFYYIRKPKQLVKIYELALARLSEMESRYDQELLLQNKPAGYWKGREFYASPGPAGADSTAFSVKMDFWNIYYLSFVATVYPDDETVNPKPLIFCCHPDSTETGKRYYLNTLEFIKDGQPRRYMYQVNDPEKSHLMIVGNLFDYTSNPSLRRHFLIEDITLNY